MIKVGIIGATGYAGAELVRILMNHREAHIEWFGSRSYIDENYADVYQNFFELVDAKCMDDNMEELASRVDVIFTATPQGFLAQRYHPPWLPVEILSQAQTHGTRTRQAFPASERTPAPWPKGWLAEY